MVLAAIQGLPGHPCNQNDPCNFGPTKAFGVGYGTEFFSQVGSRSGQSKSGSATLLRTRGVEERNWTIQLDGDVLFCSRHLVWNRHYQHRQLRRMLTLLHCLRKMSTTGATYYNWNKTLENRGFICFFIIRKGNLPYLYLVAFLPQLLKALDLSFKMMPITMLYCKNFLR